MTPRCFIICVCAIMLGASHPLFSQTAEQIYDQNVKSTVTILTDQAQGSGFFVAPYTLATNYHVIEGAYIIECKFGRNDMTYPCTVIGYDEDRDLALLRCDDYTKKPVTFSKSPLRIGQNLFVIGSPEGIDATFSRGILSQIYMQEGYFQMDAAISHGSSGGPVFNEKGELVGISTAGIEEGQNLNFAILSSVLAELMGEFELNTTKTGQTSQRQNQRQNQDILASNYTYEKPNSALEIFRSPINHPALRLDYYTHGDGSCFYFHYEPTDIQKTKLFSGDLYVKDRATGKLFPCTYNEIKEDSRTIYGNTSTRFSICCERLPDQVINFDIVEKNGSGILNLYDLNFNDFEQTEKDEYLYYSKNKGEGTISFLNFVNCASMEIRINNQYQGKITRYFTDMNYKYDCGLSSEASLTLRLPCGTYSYSASSSNDTWSGTIVITEDCCEMLRIRE